MNNTDGRKIDRKTLEYLRKRSVDLREAGKSNKETASILGMTPETTSRWYSAYKKKGKDALKVRKCGRPKQSGKRLSDEQEARIIRLLIDKNLKQLQFKFALWTREAVLFTPEYSFTPTGVHPFSSISRRYSLGIVA